ncbi:MULTISPECIES: DEAD/DEAH box helicase [unclassified Lentimicrobium]|uniref:DEAD/DEAH box helicase n=1 Tax=unclassified Lentimicrobium TaxID=2677434 RepID=UPI001553ACC8|nr:MULTISPECIES: DEAD/DEAH box helicase [unclassified Lentimicrobium]NPD45698.1 DEAD/DEAH box helicase family protein [Lentimicrobium sp. S6]NPD85577.1 DEAD/DEAH box helicase family protein [Lentimicrobium sp. L6]
MNIRLGNTKDYIDKYVNSHATSVVVKRGKQMYRSGKVDFEDYSERTDGWSFSVHGTMKYRIIILGVDNLNIETSCTCPFDWGNLCKHSIAALYFVSDNIGNQPTLLESKNSFSHSIIASSNQVGIREDYEITDYNTITAQFIKDNLPTALYEQLIYYHYNNIYSSLKTDHNSIVFIAPNNKPIITFYLSEGKVFISSTKKTYNKHLSIEEAQCLYSIAKSNSPDILEYVFSGKLLEKEKETLNSYGLFENIKFEDYFYYIFDKTHGITCHEKKVLSGIIPIIDTLTNQHLSLIDKINNDIEFINHLNTNSEERRIGFVIKEKWDSYYNYMDKSDESQDFHKGFEIVPIIGKTNKQGTILSTHIKEYLPELSETNLIKKDAKAEKILGILNQYENTNNEETKFLLLKETYNLLIGQTFVYGSDTPSFEVKKKHLIDINLSQEPLDIKFEVEKEQSFLLLKMKYKIGNVVFDRTKSEENVLDNCIHQINGHLHFVKNYKAAQYISQFPENLKMVTDHQEQFFKKVIEPISKNFEIHYSDQTYIKESVELDFHRRQLFLSEKNEHILFTLYVVYDNDFSTSLNTTGHILSKNGNTITEYKRNFELEDDFIEVLAQLHPKFELQKNRKLFYLHHSDFTENMWFYKFFDHLQNNNIEVYGLKDLKNFKYSPYKGKISTSVSSGQDWFDVNINIRFGDKQASLSDIKKAVINKQRFIQLSDGSVGVLPSEWFHKLEKYFRNGIVKKDKLEISKLHFSVVDELFENIDDEKVILEIAEKRRRLQSFTEISKTDIPKEITADLRHYQKEGLNWLNFLDEMQWGGILADDMGLGKTLQILTFLQYQSNKKKSTSLIIVPTTLLFNWENEIQKFAPQLEATYYYGTNRNKDTAHFKDFDLVFTTYGILLRDIESLSQFKFNYVVLDESQAIKNPASRRYKAANLINARNRIALTGTPIENGTFDLFAQMNFVNKGFFGSPANFKDNYSNPIDKEANELIAGELHRITHPFILRRTKEKVAQELPDKTEDIIYCEMEAGQRKVYDAYRNEFKNQLLHKIEDEGINKSKMMVLEALTRLRQICDSPSLLNSNDIIETQSIKIKEIIRHITNKTGDHKILIFSQFVKMLALIKDELDKINIDYEYLDGKSSVKQRENSVNNFQDNNDLRVFLISLKAGGTGLNLTAADYVYIIDPWWNPAVENQAIDRCYRIGQDKKVFAYRMICKNTVEEKIINLQNKKKKIAGDIIQTDENIMKTLDTKDIQELFS